MLIFSKPKLSFNFCRLIFDVSGAESEQTFWNVALPTRQTVAKTPRRIVTLSIFVVRGIVMTFVIAETTLIDISSVKVVIIEKHNFDGDERKSSC